MEGSRKKQKDYSDIKKGWTSIECLILAQLVFQIGEDNWAAISRQMKAHSCISKPPDYFAAKACQAQFNALLASQKKTQSDTTDSSLTPVTRLARRLHIERIAELKAELEEDDRKFRQLIQEIIDIRDGKLDDKLRQEFEQSQNNAAPTTGAPRIRTEVGTPTKPPPISTAKHNEVKATTAMDVESPLTVNTPQSIKAENEGKKDDEAMTDGYTSGLESVDGSQSRPRKRSMSREDDKKRNFRKICMPVWDKIADHRYGNVFKNIRDDQIPGYSDIIKRPMNLLNIKQRIRDGDISTPDEFHRDLLLMLTNVFMFHNEGGDIYEMAVDFKRFIDAELSQFRITYQRARQ